MGRERQQAKSEAAIAKVLAAAVDLFSKQGYRSSTMRQIADTAGLSMGSLYYHFPSKEAIFERLFDEYWERLLDPDSPLNRVFAQARFPEDLEELAGAVEQVVAENIPYILLIYVDVIEFGGKHIHAFYADMAKRFEDAYRRRFEERRRAGELGDVDPMVGVMVATRWFFYFFTVEKCFGVPMHLGISQQQAIEEFIRLLRFGLLPRTTPSPVPEEIADQPTRKGESKPGRRK
ncbi:MAG: TetR/AcrR family transcriptional regulator [bacterium]|nr:TetR/AcrR family transcriptional regulator [bacterium]